MHTEIRAISARLDAIDARLIVRRSSPDRNQSARTDGNNLTIRFRASITPN
jgi:hypothetical protein